MDEPRDDRKLRQLLFPGLRPNIVRRYVSGPVHPVPRSVSRSILQEVRHRPQRQITLAVGPPVPGLHLPLARKARAVATAQRVLAVCGAAGYVLLSVEGIMIITLEVGLDPKQSQVTYRFVVSSEEKKGNIAFE